MYNQEEKTMRQILIATYLLVCCFPSSQASAQNCKPDVSREDKISKQRIDIWTQVLFSTSFGGSLMSTSEVGITATVGRYGTVNAVNLQIQKKEESATNAAFESAYRAAVGKPFYFGFKNGDPVAFVVTEVNNEAKVQQGLFAAKGVTTVVLSAVVQDKDLARLRDALTSRQIDAVRMVLTGDVRIEKSVNDKNGKKMMEKFSCFYQSLDNRGVALSAAGPQNQTGQSVSASNGGEVPRDYAASALGKYVRKGKTSDYVELGPYGQFSVHQDGKSLGGNYAIQGDTLILTSPMFRNQKETAHFIGDTIKDKEGIIWEKQAEPAKAAGAQLTIDQVIQMVTAKLPDDIIITTIQKSSSKFELTPDALIKLKTAGVSDAVIRAMTR
jgi:hypothetical protein